MGTTYPRSYRQADSLLVDKKSVLLHDDLRLRRVRDGAVVTFRGRTIVRFSSREPVVRAYAGRCGEPVPAVVVEHLNRFLPAGYAARWSDGDVYVVMPGNHGHWSKRFSVPAGDGC